MTDVQRLSLALMSMEPICKDVMTSQVMIRNIIKIIILISLHNFNNVGYFNNLLVKMKEGCFSDSGRKPIKNHDFENVDH